MTRARDVVEVVARALVDQPDAVAVTETDRRDGTQVALRAGPGELGKLIGRQGRTAEAIRTLADVAAELAGGRARVDFLDDRR